MFFMFFIFDILFWVSSQSKIPNVPISQSLFFFTLVFCLFVLLLFCVYCVHFVRLCSILCVSIAFILVLIRIWVWFFFVVTFVVVIILFVLCIFFSFLCILHLFFFFVFVLGVATQTFKLFHDTLEKFFIVFVIRITVASVAEGVAQQRQRRNVFSFRRVFICHCAFGCLHFASVGFAEELGTTDFLCNCNALSFAFCCVLFHWLRSQTMYFDFCDFLFLFGSDEFLVNDTFVRSFLFECAFLFHWVCTFFWMRSWSLTISRLS